MWKDTPIKMLGFIMYALANDYYNQTEERQDEIIDEFIELTENESNQR